MKKSQEFVIVHCCDENYLKYIGPHYMSVIDHIGDDRSSSQLFHVSFVLLYAGIPGELLFKLRDMILAYAVEAGKDVSLSVVPVECRIPEDNTPYPKAVYLPFLIGSVLPKTCELALYLDIDIHCCGDILGLFETNFADEEVIAAVMDRCDTTSLFNSGVVLYHLPRFRAGGYEKELFETRAQLMKSLKYADQDVLNSVFEGKWHSLSFVWNFRSLYSTVPASRKHCSSPHCLTYRVRNIANLEHDVKLLHTALPSPAKLWDNVLFCNQDPITRGYGLLVAQCESVLQIQIASDFDVRRLFKNLFIDFIVWDLSLETVKNVAMNAFRRGVRAVSFAHLMSDSSLLDEQLTLFLLRKYEKIWLTLEKPDEFENWTDFFLQYLEKQDEFDPRLQKLSAFKFIRLK